MPPKQMTRPSRYTHTMPVPSPTPGLRLARRMTTAGLLFVALGVAAVAAPAAGAAVPHYEAAAADGSAVFFTTTEQLSNGDADGRRDVYERTFDDSIGASGDYVTRELSTGPIGGNAAFDVNFEGESVDGTRVFFSTQERLTSSDTDQASDVYVRDLETGATSRVSIGESACAPACGNGPTEAVFAGTSDDGNEVFFVTTERLASADQDDAFDVYMRDLDGSSTSLVSAAVTGCGPSCGNGNFTATLRGISADGSRAFFATSEPLGGGDGDSATDIYSRALPSGPTELVSAGAPGCGSCGNGASAAAYVGSSATGGAVFFETSEGLVPGDLDGANDVYERTAGTTTLISGGTENTPANVVQENGSNRPAISSDGTKVLFVTAESLVGAGDSNGAADIYLWSGSSPTLVTSGTCKQGGGSCGSTFDAMTSDGTKLLFTTTEALDETADTDTSADVYEQGTSAGAPILVSDGAAGCDPCGTGDFSAIFNGASADASKVFFTSSEPLAPQDEDSSADIYLHDLGVPATTLVSRDGNCPVACPVVYSGASTDGSHVFFQTDEQLSIDDGDAEADIYERAGGQTRLVSTGNSAVVGPSTPILTATNPASPNPSTTPTIVGQSDPLTSVKIYTASNCSGTPVATGTAAELGSPGIAVTVAAGTTTNFRATATDENGDTSGCSEPLTYKQEDPPPPPPPPAEEGGGTGTGSGGTGTSTGGGTGTGGKKDGSSGKGIVYVTPDTLITYGPAFKTRKRRPVFRFTDATGQPGTFFFCKLDRRRWRSCGSPLKLSPLGTGKHVLRVKAVNAVGTSEPQPVQRAFKVVR
jgi:Tol biopolymer transport system component